MEVEKPESAARISRKEQGNDQFTFARSSLFDFIFLGFILQGVIL